MADPLANLPPHLRDDPLIKAIDWQLLHAAVHKVATDQRRKQPTLRAVAEVYLRMKEREEARDG